ncbi:MAG: class I SAM-dependent methyltransferase [Methanotrichaceae archaeon]
MILDILKYLFFDIKNIIRTGLGLEPDHLYENIDRYHSYQENFIRLCPEKGMIVDIGSGNYPFPKATVLADKFTGVNVHRTNKLVRDDRDFIILDIEYMPFKDKSIDYLYCSHILEHVNDPKRACQEIIRVAKAGYIETPTFMKDALFAWAKGMHKWYTVVIDNKIVFFEYTKRQLEGVRSDYWKWSILSQHTHLNQEIFFPNQDIFNSILEWKGSFEVEVFRLKESIKPERETGN